MRAPLSGGRAAQAQPSSTAQASSSGQVGGEYGGGGDGDIRVAAQMYQEQVRYER